jgi:TPR repeat protein
MGEIYLKGKSVPVDKAKARSFYEAAAEAGHSQGQILQVFYIAEENTQASFKTSKILVK